MSKSILLFLSGFFGEEVLRCLSKTKSRPFIAVYPPGGRRRKSEFDFSKFAGMFQIFTVNADSFSNSLLNNPLPLCDYFLTVDWTKDFFHKEPSVPSTIYHAHPSLLPLYRGYASLSEQFLRGVCISGLSIYEDNGIVDGGDIVFREKIKISLEDTPETFLKNCAGLTADFIEKLEEGREFLKMPQDFTRSFYVARTRNNQKGIDFNASSYAVHNFIRAYSFPFPNARFYYKGHEYRALSSSIESWSGVEGEAGEILNITPDGLEAACGDGSVMIKNISFAGGIIDVENSVFKKGEFLS